ncbi:hypothetical protein NDU88_007937 [Pleurodeles waltl]|uniref:Uncharacterized protein n=1 Tax=Pleurodeles waltl TaxID=8319 RepID=A0AAV7PNB9_PLEWA|nr:hypothetical protein NDU88_007937 [Pleurodeles waltl]
MDRGPSVRRTGVNQIPKRIALLLEGSSDERSDENREGKESDGAARDLLDTHDQQMGELIHTSEGSLQNGEISDGPKVMAGWLE